MYSVVAKKVTSSLLKCCAIEVRRLRAMTTNVLVERCRRRRLIIRPSSFVALFLLSPSSVGHAPFQGRVQKVDLLRQAHDEVNVGCPVGV